MDELNTQKEGITATYRGKEVPLVLDIPGGRKLLSNDRKDLTLGGAGDGGLYLRTEQGLVHVTVKSPVLD